MFVHPATSAFVDVSFVFVEDQGSFAGFFPGVLSLTTKSCVTSHLKWRAYGGRIACEQPWKVRWRSPAFSSMVLPEAGRTGLAKESQNAFSGAKFSKGSLAHDPPMFPAGKRPEGAVCLVRGHVNREEPSFLLFCILKPWRSSAESLQPSEAQCCSIGSWIV